jgi:hypothetical protein
MSDPVHAPSGKSSVGHGNKVIVASRLEMINGVDIGEKQVIHNVFIIEIIIATSGGSSLGHPFPLRNVGSSGSSNSSVGLPGGSGVRNIQVQPLLLNIGEYQRRSREFGTIEVTEVTVVTITIVVVHLVPATIIIVIVITVVDTVAILVESTVRGSIASVRKSEVSGPQVFTALRSLEIHGPGGGLLRIDSVGGFLFEVTSFPSVQHRVTLESVWVRVSLVDVISMDESVESPGFSVVGVEVVDGRIGFSIGVAVDSVESSVVVVVGRLFASISPCFFFNIPHGNVRRNVVCELVKVV